MPGQRQFHGAATIVLSALMIVLGVGLVVEAITGHGSAISPRMLLGVLFVAAGAGRIYLRTKRGQGV
jgi:hypothetical protein